MQAALDAFTPALDPVLAAQALTAASMHGEPTAARAILGRAAQLATTMSPRDRAAVLPRVARAYARLGDASEAARLALTVEDPVARAAALLGIAQELATKDEAAAAARVQEAADAGRRADPQPLCQAFVAAAQEASAAKHKTLAAAMLKAAEQAAGRASGETRQTMLRNVSGLYGTLLDDWPAAMRVAEAAGDEWTLRTSRARAVVQLAAAGQTERAAALFRTAAADKVGYIGLALLQGLGEAHLQLAPGTSADGAMAVQPPELRDYVLAAGARKALAAGGPAAGDPAAALDWAQRIASSNVGEELLYQAAVATLAKADKAGLPKAVETARRVSAKMRATDRGRNILFDIGRRYLAVGDTAGVEGVLEEFRKTKPVETEDGRTLSRMAILEQAIGQPDQARKDLAQGLDIVNAVTCSSCREPAMTDMLRDLLDAGDMALLMQGVHSAALPTLPARLAIGAVEDLPGLPAERKVLGLRVALQSAATERLHAYGAEALVLVAAAWQKQGLTPSAEDLAVMPAPPAPAVEPEGPAPAAVPADAPALLVYFTRTGCAHCREARELMDKLAATMPNVQIKEYELRKRDATLLNETFCEAFGVPERDRQIAPSIFSSKGALIGHEITSDALSGLIQAARGQLGPEAVYAVRPELAERSIRHRYESLNLLVVAGAGLFDGLNPCAFTVIIFFLSYLAFLGRDKREIIAAGIVFTIAVFLTYLSIGIFLQKVLEFGQERSAAFSQALYGATALVVLVAAVLSIRDGVRCLQGRAQDMTLVLPDKLKSKIRLTIAKRARMGLTVGAMAVLGVVVAVIEFPCTGQVYGPTIVFGLNNLPQYRWGALGWLVLYNLCFILPLIAVFIAVFFGLTSEKLTAIFRRHIAATKFALAGLFTVLFAFMLKQLL